MLEKTLTANNKVRLNTQYPVVAGVDENNVPQILRVKSDGTLDLGGVVLPEFDDFSIENYGATNNIHYVIYTLDGNEVGRWTFRYAGGGSTDNDILSGGGFSKP